MSALTEVEIFDCLSSNLKIAAECADDLARLPAKGPTYDRYRHALKLVEGACRQASAWREDTRWLPIGRMMAEAHQRAGNWLRGFKDRETGQRIAFAPGEQNPLFRKLAENLRGLHKIVEELRTKATHHVGMILPQELPGPHRDTRPVHISGLHMTNGGIIVPASAV